MIGNYFKGGKTVVIDDQYQEAKPLLDSLYKLQIPHYYSDGRPSSDFRLPDENHYRLIFMDLNLWPQASRGEDYKNFKNGHIKILESILKNINHSYLLVIWSQEEENYLEHYLKIFDSSQKYHTLKRPYQHMSLQKTDYFVDDGEGGKTFKKDKEKQLFNKILFKLKSMDAFKIFCDWESKICNSSGETVDSILESVKAYEGEDKEKNLANLLTLLCTAYSGDKGFLDLKSNQSKTDAVLLALNEVLHDDVDRLILNKREKEFKNWQASTDSEIKELRKKSGTWLINTKLFTYSPNRPELSGSVYRIRKDKTTKAIFKDLTHNKDEKIKKDCKDAFKNENDGRGPDPATLKNLVDSHKNRMYKELIIPVEVNVTPLCDVSQGNDPLHRVIPGFIIPEEIKSQLELRGYKSQLFMIDSIVEEYHGNYFIFLDFRYFKSVSRSSILQRKKESKKLPRYLFTLRNNLVNDIQISISNHVSRLGVLALQQK